MVGAEKVTVVSPEEEYDICLTALELWDLLCSVNSEQNDWADLQSCFKTQGTVCSSPSLPLCPLTHLSKCFPPFGWPSTKQAHEQVCSDD